MKKSLKLVAIFGLVAATMGCAKIREKIVIGAIKDNPVAITEALNDAFRSAQEKKREEAFKKEQQAMEDQFSNPVSPEISDKRAYHGPKDAPITIVEYSDFQCGYCGKAFNTVKRLMDEPKYKGKIKLVYKHLPVTGAAMSMPAAEVFEAISLMDKDKAFKFHDKVFEAQGALRNGGEKHLKKLVKDIVGGDTSKVFAKMKSDEIQARLAADREEATKYEINGTPAFVINGVFLKGAYPIEKFREVIDRHLQAKK